MNVAPKQVKIYCFTNGESPFVNWINNLKDERARDIIKARLARVRLGNLGNVKSVGQGVFELKVSYGPGYRIYFAQLNYYIIILLCAGNKKTQNEDIKKAKNFWKCFKKNEKYGDY